MSDLLEKMRRNPAGDWSIRDVETVCQAAGIRCIPPSGGGSHYPAAVLTIRSRTRLGGKS